MKGNYLVAICDILGFSKLVINNDVDIVLKFGLEVIKKTLNHSIFKNDFPNENVSFKDLINHAELGISWFSDTILIYSRKDTEEGCKTLLQTVGWLIFENMFSTNTRLRVGISYGEAFMDDEEEIYIGKSIVDAYQMEKIQEWSGGALTKAAEKRFGNYLASLNPMESWVVPYDVPIKHNSTDKLLAINWTNGIHDRNLKKFNWGKDKSEPSEKDYREQPDVVEKWRNTKEFHERVCWSCFSNLNPSDHLKPPGKFWP